MRDSHSEVTVVSQVEIPQGDGRQQVLDNIQDAARAGQISHALRHATGKKNAAVQLPKMQEVRWKSAAA